MIIIHFGSLSFIVYADRHCIAVLQNLIPRSNSRKLFTGNNSNLQESMSTLNMPACVHTPS